MSNLDPQSAMALAVPAIGVIVWLVRLEGRINTNEALQKTVLEEVKYIRDRIDDVLTKK
jgi:hypothetical protein